jgi:hypothetical protein
LPPGETEESQEVVRVWLLAEYKKSVRDTIEVRKAMKQTYASQRIFINVERAPISTVCEKWPFLLTFDGLMNHFECLMGIDLIAKMDEFLGNQAGKLFSFAENKGNEVVQTMVRKLVEASKFRRSDVPKTVGCFMLLL